jgi:diguanylate cyclase (GGDEF)-like protein
MDVQTDAAAGQALEELARLAALCCHVPLARISLTDVDLQRLIPAMGHDAMDLATEEGVVFHASVPLVSHTGHALGALTIADFRRRHLRTRQLQVLRGFAAQATLQLELRRNLMRMQQENATEPLTRLGNRRAFQERLGTELALTESVALPVALLFIDVDHFKTYNDSFGHAAGDAVLWQLADVMRRSCRERDFAARIGGEEFAMILPATSREDAFMLAKWLRRRVQREPWPYRPITISVGVALSARGESSLQLAERADAALYRSKRDGRNRVTLSEQLDAA